METEAMYFLPNSAIDLLCDFVEVIYLVCVSLAICKTGIIILRVITSLKVCQLHFVLNCLMICVTSKITACSKTILPLRIFT